MAIITPLKKIFNWQTANEKIPYKVYTAYITADDNDDLYAFEVLENTIGAVTFETVSTGHWLIKIPYTVPRLKIIIPGFSDYWFDGNALITTTPSKDANRLVICPGFGIDDSINCHNTACKTNCIGIRTSTNTIVGWRTFFNCPSTGECTAYPIEIRVYN